MLYTLYGTNNLTITWKYSNRTKHKIVRFECRTKENEIRTEMIRRYPIFRYNSKKNLIINTKYL